MLNITAIHTVLIDELRNKFSTLPRILLEGQSKKAPNAPRITYTQITNGRLPRKSTIREYSDPGGVPTTTYKDLVYNRYRYSVIVNEESKPNGGGSYIELLRDIVEELFGFFRTQAFEIALEDLGIRYRMATDITDGTISRLPFFEKRFFFDVVYGFTDVFTRAEGSFIETINPTLILPTPPLPSLPDPILYTTLDDLDAIENPLFGPTGAIVGTGGSFEPGKFGNGFLIPLITSTARVDFTGFRFENKGAIEFWLGTTFDSTDESVDTPYLFTLLTGASQRITGLIDQAAGNQGVSFYIFSGGSLTNVKYAPVYNSGEFHHYRFVFDSAGIEETTDQRRFYFDGVRQTRVSGDLESKAIDLDLVLNLSIGNISVADRGAKSTIDNFKVYDEPVLIFDLTKP